MDPLDGIGMLRLPMLSRWFRIRIWQQSWFSSSRMIPFSSRIHPLIIRLTKKTNRGSTDHKTEQLILCLSTMATSKNRPDCSIKSLIWNSWYLLFGSFSCNTVYTNQGTIQRGNIDWKKVSTWEIVRFYLLSTLSCVNYEGRSTLGGHQWWRKFTFWPRCPGAGV